MEGRNEKKLIRQFVRCCQTPEMSDSALMSTRLRVSSFVARRGLLEKWAGPLLVESISDPSRKRCNLETVKVQIVSLDSLTL